MTNINPWLKKYNWSKSCWCFFLKGVDDSKVSGFVTFDEGSRIEEWLLLMQMQCISYQNTGLAFNYPFVDHNEIAIKDMQAPTDGQLSEKKRK